MATAQGSKTCGCFGPVQSGREPWGPPSKVLLVLLLFLVVMSIAETDDEVQTVSDGCEVDANGDARMRKTTVDDSPLSRVPTASAREVIRKSDAEAERDALRAAADAAAVPSPTTRWCLP